uniref:Uncharacterized protein n=1 Tax=Hemiselmis tepida TaxID=464990 RepID=A0A7S0VVU3_9CRYP|mmetsp:Transcript_26296/g.66874  ORF Transcript_26296/g.66874 Transcript_26296/m.66874 type:complete len:306 (+) Transcript_26296:90-1007(+)
MVPEGGHPQRSPVKASQVCRLTTCRPLRTLPGREAEGHTRERKAHISGPQLRREIEEGGPQTGSVGVRRACPPPGQHPARNAGQPPSTRLGSPEVRHGRGADPARARRGAGAPDSGGERGSAAGQEAAECGTREARPYKVRCTERPPPGGERGRLSIQTRWAEGGNSVSDRKSRDRRRVDRAGSTARRKDADQASLEGRTRGSHDAGAGQPRRRERCRSRGREAHVRGKEAGKRPRPRVVTGQLIKKRGGRLGQQGLGAGQHRALEQEVMDALQNLRLLGQGEAEGAEAVLKGEAADSQIGGGRV